MRIIVSLTRWCRGAMAAGAMAGMVADSEKGPAATPPGMWVRRQATEDVGVGVCTASAPMCIHAKVV